MNPLPEFQTIYYSNLKDLATEKTESIEFNSKLKQVLNKEGGVFSFWRRLFPPSPQIIQEVQERTTEILRLENTLTEVSEDIKKFDVKSGGQIGFLRLERKFKTLCQEILLCRVNVLAKVLTLDNGTRNDALKSLQEKYKGEYDQNSMVLADLQAQLTRLEQAPSVEEVRASAESKPWEDKEWARLLTESNEPGSVNDVVAASFRETINKLRGRKAELKEGLAGEVDVLKKNQYQQQLNEINRALYHCVLNRCIDVIAEKQHELKRRDLSANTVAILENDIEKLNSKFRDTLDKYEKLGPSRRPIYEAFSDDIKNNTSTIRYFSGRIDSIAEIRAKKHYANIGYSMVENIEKWSDKDLELAANITDEVLQFAAWATNHPQQAAPMIKDITLLIKLYDGERADLLTRFNKVMKNGEYSMAFNTNFAGTDWEPANLTEELNFRALADLARYAPALKSGNFQVIQGLFLGHTNIQEDSDLGRTSRSRIEKGLTIANRDANAVANVVQAKGFQELLESQRTIELVKTVGMIQNNIVEPKDFVDSYKQAVKVWWKTIVQGKPTERFVRILVQVVLPSLCILGAIGVLIIAGGPIIAVPAAIAIATGLSSVALEVLRTANASFNKMYADTYKTVIEQEKQLAQVAAKEILIRGHKDQIVDARDSYIKDLQAARRLPWIRLSADCELTTFQKDAAKEIANKIISQLISKENSGKDPVKLLNDQFKTADAMKEAKGIIQNGVIIPDDGDEQDKIAAFIANEALKQIISEWLNPRVEARLIDVALAAAQDKSDAALEALKKTNNGKVKEEISKYVNEQLNINSTPGLDPASAATEFCAIWNKNRSN